MLETNIDSPISTVLKRSFTCFESSNPDRFAQSSVKRRQSEHEKADLILHQPQPKRLSRLVNDSIIEWIETGLSWEVDRRKHCLSEVSQIHSNTPSIPKRLIKSAPPMNNSQTSDGFVVPPAPMSSKSQNEPQFNSIASSDISDIGSSTKRSGKKSLVEDPYYRVNNLAENGIYLRSSKEQFPTHVASVVNRIRKDRRSPIPEMQFDQSLESLEMGAGEPDVEEYFRRNVFPKPTPQEPLKRVDKNPMTKAAVPNVGTKLRLSTPVPDMIYGYNRVEAFPDHQAQLRSMGNEMISNNQGLIYPFFVIEFKGDGPSGSGSMWVATNQCLGDSSSCVNIAQRLNHRLQQCQSENVKKIDNAAFSIAMNGTEARLYVSWKHDELRYYTQKIDSFLLQRPSEYMEFRKHVLNIIDWGKNERLIDIRESLSRLLEESIRKTSQLAKSRSSPSSEEDYVHVHPKRTAH